MVRIVSVTIVLRLLAGACASASSVHAQAIIAQNGGLANPTQVFDFGAVALPDFTPVTTQFASLTIGNAAYRTIGYANNVVLGHLTKDPTNAATTLVVRLAYPVVASSFVYHQVGAGTSTIRALAQGVEVAAFSGSWSQQQPNNFFGFANTFHDELRVDFVGDFRFDTLAVVAAGVAACVLHNGSGVNPVDFTCATLPRLGAQWQGAVAVHSGTLATVLAYGPGGLGTPLALLGGELLLQPAPPLVTFTGFGSHGFAVPPSPGFIGLSLAFQAARLDLVGGAPSLVLLNAIELILGT